MVFELGKYYKHTTYHYLYVCGVVNSHAYGMGLIAESIHKGRNVEFMVVGSDENSSVNYTEITKEEYMETCFSE